MRAAAVLVVGLVGACVGGNDVALDLRELGEATDRVTDPQLKEQIPTLDCGAGGASLAALCVEVYTVAASRTTMQASCHDAPAVQVGGAGLADGGEADLKAYLRGLGSLADGIATDAANANYVRLLGYADASRTRESLAACGISPAFPQHLDATTSPPSLPVYLLCRPASGGLAEQIFEDYCGTGDFVSLFP